MKTQTRIGLVIGTVVAMIVVAIVGAIWLDDQRGEPEESADDTVGSSILVPEDARLLGEEGESGVTFVEFIDFECEMCREAFPVVEQLREEYAGEVTFVVRYFPLDGHTNSVPAARAVEAAGRQDQFEAMYRMMFETQPEWGESDEARDDVFRGFAEEIGLDMERYDVDVASEEVAERVQRDYDDALSLGLRGTPTFYIGGRLTQPETVGDLYDAVDEAVAEARD